MIGKGAFQETDFFGMTLPVVKHSYLVTDVNEIPTVVKQAFKIATSGRPGPVVIDVPKNIQQTRAQVLFPDEVDIAGFDPEGLKASELELNEIVGLIEKSERPLLYVGGGIISADASDALRRLVAATGIPVTSTIMGVGAFPETHELSLRWLGMHGSAYANWAVSGEFEKDAEGNSTKVTEGADLLLAFGVRFDDRVTGKVEKFCEHGTIVHIDIVRDQQKPQSRSAGGQRDSLRDRATGRHDQRAAVAEKIHRMAGAGRPLEGQGAVRLSGDRRGDEVAAH
jgi:acetolactate synthase-1/2/3 large subunit